MTSFLAVHPSRHDIALDELSVRAILGRIHPLHPTVRTDVEILVSPDDVLDALPRVRTPAHGLCTAPASDWLRLRALRRLCLSLARDSEARIAFVCDLVVPRWIALRQLRAERDLSAAFAA